MAGIRRGRNLASACAGVVVGCLAVFGSVMLINDLNAPEDTQQATDRTSFEVARVPEPDPPKVVRKPPPPNPMEPPPTPPRLLKSLESGVSSVDISIPQVEVGEIGASADSLLGDTSDVVMTSDTVDQAPQVVSRGPLQYPASARNQGVEGYVLLSVLVDNQGEIRRVKVLEAKPAGVFEEAAKQGIRSWRFKPGSYQGQNVRTWVRQRITFNLS